MYITKLFLHLANGREFLANEKTRLISAVKELNCSIHYNEIVHQRQSFEYSGTENEFRGYAG